MRNNVEKEELYTFVVVNANRFSLEENYSSGQEHENK